MEGLASQHWAGVHCAQVIKDYATTFYQAALVPAANVHLALDAGAGRPILRPEIAALEGPPPAERGLPLQRGSAMQATARRWGDSRRLAADKYGSGRASVNTAWLQHCRRIRFCREACLASFCVAAGNTWSWKWGREHVQAAGPPAEARSGEGRGPAGRSATGGSVPRWMKVGKK